MALRALELLAAYCTVWLPVPPVHLGLLQQRGNGQANLPVWQSLQTVVPSCLSYAHAADCCAARPAPIVRKCATWLANTVSSRLSSMFICHELTMKCIVYLRSLQAICWGNLLTTNQQQLMLRFHNFSCFVKAMCLQSCEPDCQVCCLRSVLRELLLVLPCVVGSHKGKQLCSSQQTEH